MMKSSRSDYDLDCWDDESDLTNFGDWEKQVGQATTLIR